MKKLALLATIAAVVWYFFHTPDDSRYFSTKEAVYSVMVLNGNAMLNGKAQLYYGGTQVIKGIEYHKFATIFDPHLGIPNEYLLTRLTENGIFARAMDNRENAPEYPLLSFPINRGIEWYDQLRGYWLHSRTFRIGSCATPSKTYHQCVHVVASRNLGELHENRTTVYAPDVGLVKMSYSDRNRTIEITRRAN